MSEDLTGRLNSALEGRYSIDRELGAGGMATVYVARDLKHERNVSLKILKPELAALLGGERFVHEIRVTANLQHPHILLLFDSGEADGFLFYAMPLAEGESLRDRTAGPRERSWRPAFQCGVPTARSTARQPRSLRPVMIDRSGAPRDVEPGWTFTSGSQTWTTLRLSPDGTRLALSIGPDDANELYVKELPDGPLVQLTADGIGSRRPRWSPDGRSILFNSQQGGRYALWSVPADGSTEPEPLLSIEGAVFQGEYSRDGGWLVYRARPVHGTDDIFAVPLDGDGLPREGAAVPLVSTEATEVDPALSPDGRWLAYVSDRSGPWEVYVRPFPNSEAALVQVSPNGGAEPVSSSAGQELFYRTAAGNLVAARYRAGEGTFEVTRRETIAEVADRGDEGGYLRSNYTPEYDVTPDGRSFVMLAVGARQRGKPSFVLVQNFLQEVRDRVGH